MEWWSFSRYQLHTDFWELTLKEFDALVCQFNKEQERTDWRIANLSCLIANAFFVGKEHPEPFKPSDFMPGKIKEQTPEQILERIKLFNALYGGN